PLRTPQSIQMSPVHEATNGADVPHTLIVQSETPVLGPGLAALQPDPQTCRFALGERATVDWALPGHSGPGRGCAAPFKIPLMEPCVRIGGTRDFPSSYPTGGHRLGHRG